MTNLAQWERVAAEPSPWPGRLRLLAARIYPCSSVLDIGAGGQTLREFLPPGCSYQAADVVPGTDVIPLDLDRIGHPEAVIIPTVDAIVLAGVLEYVERPLPALMILGCYASRILFSCATTDTTPDRSEREAQGWVSHLSAEEIEIVTGARRFGEWEGQALYEVGR